MKKILLATAMMFSAGMAMAEVTLSGDANMGVVHDGQDAEFSSEINLRATMSGETDSGLGFGAQFDMDEAEGAADGTAGKIHLSGGFGRFSMGDELSAAEAMIGNLPEIGFSDIAKNDIAYLTGDGVNGTAPTALYSTTLGSFTGAASLSDGMNGVDELSLAGKYRYDSLTFAAGLERADLGAVTETHAILSVDAKIDQTSVKAFYGKGADAAEGAEQFGLGVTHGIGAIDIAGLLRSDELPGGERITSYGLGASYDLGAGAQLIGGIADDDMAGSDPVADIGVSFRF
jgi:outer membrane protein OmpU